MMMNYKNFMMKKINKDLKQKNNNLMKIVNHL